jgi:hypothetical protein
MTAMTTAMTSPAPITSAAEADQLITHVTRVMDTLIDVLQQETELVRAGRLAQAATCEKLKGDLSRLYIADTLRLRASHSHLSRIVPAAKLEALRKRHDAFRVLLQTNLTVLATAHAVSEGIIRGLSDQIARKSTPQTYGASGRTNVPSRGAGVPLAVSRSL